MRIIKKVTSIFIAAALLSVSVFAAECTAQADGLNKLGLFKGTENGYELDKNFTRAEGAAMLVRLLGKEKEVLSAQPIGLFVDVPANDWAAPYVEYCYNYSITKGTGDSSYSPDEAMSGSQYITLVLRALGYENVEPENADIAAAEYGLLSSQTAREIMVYPAINRDKMVFISYRALSVKSLGGQTLIEKLIADGAVMPADAKALKLID